jgi:hypothetical protein
MLFTVRIDGDCDPGDPRVEELFHTVVAAVQVFAQVAEKQTNPLTLDIVLQKEDTSGH